ncbi:non-ribosomal peptide synthase/polyketide synthase [Pyxidicoccus caerfyrddinensis]|uniref:non-ribosomal peptide synthase/polyketide synthase n=1 Tax=Pyxidicoccus caerfyrddinensis TaxID=2709663 RepID=UPI0013DC7268|nr:non-ribosomal peptide synthase/polyketide synthase [Pyxidicoccus caerfyrddinensis]
MSDILKRLASLSPEKRDLLLKQLQAKGARSPQPSASPPLEARPRGDAPLPLSFAQQRLWFLEQLEPGTARYNVPVAVRLRGALDTSVLERVFNELLHRHEPLRTTFQLTADTSAQVIARTAGLRLAVVDLTVLPTARREEEARRLTNAEAQRPFDLERGPLLRATLLKLEAQEHVLLLTMHHIVSDGWSMGVLVREVGMLYAAFSEGQPSPLPELSVQYADYAVWQREWLQGKELERHLTFWKEQLTGVSPALELPTDRPRPPEQTFHGAVLPVKLSRELSESLKTVCQREGVTPFMLLLSAFQVLLHRYSGQESFCIGAPMAGRDQAQLEGLIGFFANTLALRTRLEGSPTFRELLQRVKESTVRAFAHQHLPFEKLVEALQPERDLSRAPLVQVLFAFQNTPASELSASGLSLSPFDVETSVSKFELELALGETPEGLQGSFTYNTDLFDAATISRLAEHLRVLLEGAVASPDSRIGELSLLTASERQQVLVKWNDTRAPLAVDTCIHHLFEAQVQRTPDAPAIGFEGQWLTYCELEERSNQLAHHLRSLGVGPEVRVGLCAERSLELVVGLFAILKAGGAYVPLDPSYPRERLAWMLEDARPAVLLAQPSLLSRLPETQGTAVVSLGDEALLGFPTHAPSPLATPDSLAYVIFTSGSTGRPKGAMNAHRAVVNRLLWMQQAYGLTSADSVLQKTPYSFDVSVWEFFWPLMVGARLVIARPGGHQEPDYLARLIAEERVTTTHFVPSMLQHFLEQPDLEQCTSLRRVMCSGEALSLELTQRCLQRLPSAHLHNLYGPTEAAVDVTAFHCLPQQGRRSIPIGRPIANTSIRILDSHLRPVPTGVPGELFIGGIQVGRGYLARPELTAERFIPDPFSDTPGARLYRTGDKARWLADGNIEYLGRLDFQVKVRGLRIELGEIEATLEKHPQVRQAVVVVRDGSRLVAYVVPPRGEQAPSTADVRDFLKQKLPEYMVPSAFVVLEALPLNSSGKLDRKALPAPDLSRSELKPAYVAPRNDVEQRLADIWALVLGLKQVGIHDNFFELGGDSIISLQVVARARRAGLTLATRQLFQHQTVAQLALVVKSASTAPSEQGPIMGPVPLTPAQQQLLAHDAAHAHHFNQAVLLASREPLDASRLERALAQVVAHHDALRLRLRQHEGAWLQENANPDEAPVLLLQVDLSASPAADQPKALEAEASRLQASFVLSQPPLLRAALFHLGNGQQRLLLIAHHLVIDGVSWRVLMEDLESAYLQAALPPKSTSFQAWARRLQAHAHSEALLAEAPLWLDTARAQVAPLPTDASGSNTYASVRSVAVALDAEETKLLLQEVPSSWRAHINDVLLTALARAVSEWTGQSGVLVNLEGHGREELFDNVDLSRTVGWFTSFPPVLLPVPASGSEGECLRSVRDSLRRLPHRGIGFGVLQWLGPTDIAQRLQALPAPQVAFNYLGQLDATAAASRLFSLASESSGFAQSPEGARPHVLDVTGSVLGGQLQLSFSYSTRLHHAATIESLAGRFLHHLRALITLRTSEDARRFSPGDFPLATLSRPSLDTVLRQAGSDVEDVYPLSPTQQGMLFHSLLSPESSTYFQQLSWTVTSALDVPSFLRAWKACLQRHTILRSSFHWEGLDRPLQVVHAQVELPFELLDWSDLAAEAQRERMEQHLLQDRQRGFDLRRAPLVRLTAVRLTESSVRFVWSHHHLLVDGWSLGLLISEVFSLYEAFRSGVTPQPAPKAPFRDYIAWLQRRDASADEAFWRAYLDAFSAPTPLPADTQAAPPRGQESEHLTHELGLSAETTAALQAFARQHQLTLHTLALASWGLVLSHYAGEQDVIFGNTVAGRPPELPGSDTLVGIFINSLPTRVRLPSGTAPLRPWLQSLQAQQLELRQHEHSPLVQIQSFSQVPRGAALFESLLVFENYPVDASMSGSASSLQVKDVHGYERTNYPLTLSVLPGQALRLRASHDAPRFEPASMRRLLEHWRNVLRSLTSASRPGDVSLLTEAERQQVLVEWNDTRAPLAVDTCIHHLFATQVQRTPDAPALGFEGSWLTFQELDTRANQLAHHLRSLGVGPEVRVGLCAERSLELVVGLFAILKAGGAYVPLDPSYPRERLAWMLEDARPAVLLAQPSLLSRLPETQGAAVVSLGDEALRGLPTHAPVSLATPDTLAYVIFTSGSTGRPKGVMVEHRSVLNLHRALRQTVYAHLPPGSRVTLNAPLAFDASVQQLVQLLDGHCLVIVPEDLRRDPRALVGWLALHRVQALDCTPSLLRLLLEEGLLEGAHVPQLLVPGGEAIDEATWEQLAASERSRTFNVYGPTEATVDATTCQVRPGTHPTIGGPLSNVHAYVLDSHLQPVPIGVPGELFIGGIGLARGYLSRPELTAERFIPHPFASAPGERLYRTGDKVRWLDNGQLDYLGRIDFQVKLRGFRIELGEIESVLSSLPSVREAVVTLREDTPGLNRLVAYLVPAAEAHPPDANALREALNQKLPEFMVPSAFVVLAALPLNSSGKLDRKALPAPDGTLAARAEWVAPRSETEQRLAILWSEVLRVQRVGLHDSFFELGGHSLLATQVISRIRVTFGVDLPIRALFETPTLEALSASIDALAREEHGPKLPPLQPIARTGALPLSFAQQRLWFLDQLVPDSALYNMPTPLRLEGTLDTAALERSLTELVRRHEVLRTSFPEEAGQPIQVIAPPAPLPLERVDLSALPANVREAEARRLIEAECRKPFSLAQGPLLRALLLKLADTEHVLLLDLHHIVSDGWSMGVLAREVVALYEAFSQGRPSPLPELPVQYADFAAWQRQWLQGETLEAQFSYWRQHLAGAPQVLELPTDKPRPATQSYRGATLSRLMPVALSQALSALCQREGVTSFMALLAGFQSLLSRYSGQTDVVVGTDIAGRTHADTEGLIGFFINQLVMRGDLSGDPTFRELLGRTRKATLGAYAHQDVPFEELVRVLNPERSLAHAPIFQVKLVLQNTPTIELRVPGLTFRGAESGTGAAKFDLTLAINETPEGLAVLCDYSTDLYEAQSMARMLEHLQVLLEAAVAHPDTHLSALPLLTRAEQRRVLVDWNITDAELPDTCAHHLFEAQVQRTPDALALQMGDTSFTYRQLEERANQLAWHLRSFGVGPEVLVGLCLERSPELVISMLAILKAGGAWLPLDPSYPTERLAFMLRDARPPVLLTQEKLADELPVQNELLVLIDSDRDSIARQPTHAPDVRVLPDNLAYVIYTSGSTGRPKGTLLRHRGLCNTARETVAFMDLGPGRRLLQFFSFAFDASVSEVFPALLSGACLVLASRDELMPGEPLLELIARQSITTLKLTPSVLAQLEPQRLQGVRTLITAGEACTPELVARFQPGRRFVNAYGPTEATVCATVNTDVDAQRVSIGRPFHNVRAYVLDASLQPVPIGVPGELFIGGIGLARGYLGRPELTAERFIPHPFASAPGERLYRTGDKVRWLDNGQLDYLGRIDLQVKLRGFRIELGEIEAVLSSLPSVREAVVTLREDTPGLKRLVAYLVPAAEAHPPDSSALREALNQKLPEFMVPSAFVALEALPLNSSGKLDRKALPAPEAARSDLKPAYVAPRDDVEQRLCDIWALVLGVKQVSIHDNFFELGGDSIISLQIVARARRAGLVLATRQLFQHQTVAQLALVAKSASEPIGEQGLVTGPVPLTPIQHHLLVHDAAHAHHYNQTVLLASRVTLEPAPLRRALAHLLAHHDALRLCFRQDGDAWQQENASPDEAAFPLLQVDLSATPAADQPTALEAEASRLQASHVLSQPPLLRAALFHLGNGQQRLLLAVHHLVVDTVSWRVLVEDIESAYQQLQQGPHASLPAKTTSFQSWARRLETHAHSEALLAEAPLWLEEARAQVAPLPTDASGSNTYASERSVAVALEAEETKLLLQEVPSAWRAQINDVLLTALAQTVSEWTGQSGVLVDLEGHGREELFDDVDVSRTVGWFTSLTPVLLPVPSGGTTGECLRSVRDSLRRLPHHGIGFGLLKWLGPTEVTRRLQALPVAQLAFNYLGQFDAAASSSRLFSLASESPGPTVSPSGTRLHALELNGSVFQGRLRFSFGYSANLHHAATIESLAGRFLHHLRALIALRTSEDARRFSPGDFPLATLSRPSLDTVLRQAGPDVEDIYPLSPTQQGILFHSLLSPESSTYFEQISWTVTSTLDLPAFLRAWKACLQRHTILRSSFHWEGLDTPLQVVHSHVELPFEQLDWSELSLHEEKGRFEQFLLEDKKRGIELRHAPLVRLTAIRLADDSVRFLWSHHHLLVDGWSLGLLISEVFSLYEAFRSGATPQPAPRAPFRDYIAWLQRRDASANAAFWRTYLEGFSSPTPLPVDTHAAPPRGQPSTHPTLGVVLCAEATAALQAFARQHQLTLNTLAMASWGLVLSQYSGEQDVVFGNTVAGRPPELPGSDTLVGLFINTLPTRVRLPSPSASLVPWLQSLQAQQLELRQYEYSPLVQVQSFSQVPRGAALFDSLLVFENYPLDASLSGSTSSLQVKDVLGFEHTNYPLTLSVLPGPSLRLRAVYDSPRFEAASMQRLLEHWRTALLSLASASRLGDVSLLSEGERHQVLVEWNDTRKDFPADACIHHLFEQQVALRPDAIAVEFGDARLTYRELDARANQLAHLLRSHGVGPDTLVALCLERSLELIVSLLAILKAGGGYLPLDASYPAQRLAFMLEDAPPRLLVTSRALRSQLSVPEHLTSLFIEELSLEGLPTSVPASGVSSRNLAYVDFTSGTTGRPKGVAIEHRSVQRLFHGIDYAHLGPEETFLLIAPVSFDASTLELWGPLLFGGRLVVFPPQSPSDLELLSQVVTRHRVTTLHLTAGLFAQVVEHKPDCLRGLHQLLTGGDVVSAPQVRRVLETLGIAVTACYGPTESTLFTSCFRMTRPEQVGSAVPIGTPIANTRVYLLDASFQPVPPGVPGELFIGGEGLARGYLARPELTAERFLPDAFSSSPGARLYRTGDVARWRPDGVLEFLGRLDSQVKVRGYRIELAEVEAALLAHPAVREAIAVVREDVPGDKRLVAYVVSPSPDQPLSAAALRDFLQQRLPEFMLPSAFVALEALPLTGNGKVDRKALPVPDGALASSFEYIAPRNETEQRLAALWCEVLRVERVGLHDSFFELGGHSLLATRIVSRLRAVFGVELPLRTLFEAPTLEALARAVETAARSAHGLALPPLRTVERAGALPLSFAQQRLWFLDQLVPDSALYNMPAPLRLEGTLDTAALERSLSELVRRHEVLRTSFPAEAGQPLQVIAPPAPLPLERVDLSALPTDAREAEARRLIEAECRKPFSLARGPMLRALLLKLDGQQHVLLLNMHHIASDGWSMSVLAREVAVLYEAFSQGQPSPLPELPVQYADFAAWQRQWLQGEALEAQLSYWRQHLAGAPQVLELPTDRPRPATQSYRGANAAYLMPASLAQALGALCQREGVTSFMALLAGFQSLLSRYSGQTDVVVGTDIAGRTHADTEGLIGFFVNQLVMRGDLSGDPSFRELLGRTRQATLGAYAHQDVPFEELVRVLNPERNLAHAPIFQVKLVLQNAPAAELRVPGLTFRGAENDTGSSKFDLTLSIQEGPEGLACMANYSTDLFQADTMARMLEHLQVLLEAAVAHPDTHLSSLPLLTEAERRRVLLDWNDTDAEVQDTSAHALIEAQARSTPDAPAVRMGEQSLTYRQLDERANQLAWHLRSLGVGPEVLVGLCLERSLELVVSILAVLKAGGAWLPLDPSYPTERLAFMLRDARPPVLLTQEKLADELPVQSELLVQLDSEWDSLISRQPTHAPDVRVLPDNLAYVIYTSGSTGRPKGTLLRHRGLCNTARSTIHSMHLRPGGRVLQFASIGFDASVWETLPTLMAGAELHLASRDELMPGAPLHQLLRQRAITAATLTPSVLAQLEPLGLEALQTLTSAGEACTPELVARWQPGRRFINAYGPTETTICATLDAEVDAGRITIGRPFDNVRAYVLDASLRPVPVGVPGELFIGGAGLARGYLGRPELTAERFIPHPFSSTPGERLYRTGDKVRWLPDGALEYLGRIDFQVKLRGFRIELGEIESVLASHPSMREAVVVLRDDGSGGKLVAYVVPSEGDTADTGALRTFAGEKLPEYMVPSAFVVLPALPLTSSGKVDRVALPAPTLEERRGKKRYTPPSTPTETLLTQLWAQVLGLEQVGIHDNFFELGGDSLMCVRLVAMAARAGLTFQVQQMFQHQTVADLAPVVSTAAPVLAPDNSTDAPRIDETLPLLPHHQWLVETFDLETEPWASTMVWDVPGETRVELLRASLAMLAEQHDVIRMRLRRTPEGWTAWMLASAGEPLVDEHDFTGRPPEAQREALLTTGRQLQDRLSISRGPALALALCRFGGAGPDKLILSIHHTLYDGYSLPLLMEDLQSTYLRLATGQPPSPLAAGSSYRHYMRTVAAHGRSEDLMKEARAFWLDAHRLQPGARLPVDLAGGRHTDRNSRRLSMTCPPELVSRLADTVHGHKDVSLNDLLLFGLARAWARWTGDGALRLDVEHNGRAGVVPGVDLARTLGATTLKFPMLLEAKASEEARSSFASLKRTVRDTVAHALDYGLLRYGPDETVRQRLAALGAPQVFFNNRGATLSSQPPKSAMPGGVESLAFPNLEGREYTVSYDLMIECDGAGPALQVTWVYSGAIHREETIRALAEDFYSQLAALVDAA